MIVGRKQINDNCFEPDIIIRQINDDFHAGGENSSSQRHVK